MKTAKIIHGWVFLTASWVYCKQFLLKSHWWLNTSMRQKICHQSNHIQYCDWPIKINQSKKSKTVTKAEHTYPTNPQHYSNVESNVQHLSNLYTHLYFPACGGHSSRWFTVHHALWDAWLILFWVTAGSSHQTTIEAGQNMTTSLMCSSDIRREN